MLVIRAVQMDLLRQTRWREFEAAARRHCEEHFPEVCQAFGPAETTAAVQAGLQKALAFGFEDAAHLLKFLNLTFTFGSDFDQLPWAREIFDEPDYLPGTRIELLCAVAAQQLEPTSDVEELQSADEAAEPMADDAESLTGGGDEPMEPVPAPPTAEPEPLTPAPPVPAVFKFDPHYSW